MQGIVRAICTRWWTAAQHIYAVDVAHRAIGNFARQEGPTAAAAMSYYALLSLLPLVIATVGIFSVALRDPELQAQVIGAIVDQLPAGANLEQQVESVVSEVAETDSSLLGIVGLLVALWTATGMFGALRRALNRAFDVPGARSFVHGKALDLLGVFGVMSLALLSVAATAGLSLLRALSQQHFRGILPNLAWVLVYLLLPFLLSFTTFAIVYRLIPNRTIRGKAVWLGALVAAVGFELAKVAFGLYVANFNRFEQLYGTLGGVAAFLVFVFVVANIVIFAAELTSELARDRAARIAGATAGRFLEQG